MASFPSQISCLLLLLLFAKTLFNGSICNASNKVGCNENDKKILLIFKQGLSDHYNIMWSWTTQEDCCLWDGVHCDNITGRVTELDLACYGLEGVINLTLLQLEFLIYLDLSYNYLTSVCIPPSCEVSKFPSHRDQSNNQSLATSSLKYLNLSYNDIGSETTWLHYVTVLPSLIELKLEFCGLRDFPFYHHVNFTSLKSLQLSRNNIISKLPNSFFHVTKEISSIDLGDNNFYGQLPIALFKLPNLNYLYLDNNKFEGPIPSLVGNLSSLISLNVSYNHLSGNLPETLGQLSNLSSLRIEDNYWVGVLSEKNFANLSSLTNLGFGSTGLEYDFDPKWVPPFQLRYFVVDNTSLSPNFLAWLYTQRSLHLLEIYRSEILNIHNADTFWSFISGIDNVELSNNFINGDISNVTLNSSWIYLDYNNFTGALPSISANVKAFGASHNYFSGSIFPFICSGGSKRENILIFLDISYNHLIGALPDCWANWKGLQYLNLRSNKISGEVPPSMALLTQLEMLLLSDNGFSGNFSLDLSNWTNLVYLVLERNKFLGGLPKTMQQNLMVFKVRTNQFTGSIPRQLCNMSSLVVIDLAENKLSGSLPQCVYDIMHDRNESHIVAGTDIFSKGRELDFPSIPLECVIDFSSNNLSGEIPKELFNLTQLWSLNLSHNHLSGKIPKEIGGVKYLESFDLSYNRLQGEIPSTISNLSFLAWLNLSYNNFIGQIPLGTQIQSFESWSFVGNLNLCGDPLPEKCNKKEETQNVKQLIEENEHDTFLRALFLGMGVGFASGFWAVCSFLFLIRVWRHKFLRFFDHSIDQLYVVVVLKFKIFREILGTNYC